MSYSDEPVEARKLDDNALFFDMEHFEAMPYLCNEWAHYLFEAP